MKNYSSVSRQRRRNMVNTTMVAAFSVIAALVLFEFLVTSGNVTNAAACVVTNVTDADSGSLRDNVNDALAGNCDDNTIRFDAGLSGQTITLANPIDIEVAANGTVNIISDIPIIVSGNNITRAFKIGFGETVTMTGFTISDGFADNGTISGNFNLGKGGAIVMEDGASLALREMTFTNNNAFVGGAIFNRASSIVTIVDSTFSNNTASSQGGVISSAGGSLDIQNSTFNNNDSNSDGGAIQHSSTLSQTVSIVNSTFTDNDGKQGILYFDGSLATVLNSTIADNQVRVGAIYAIDGADVTVQNSIIYDVKKDPDSGNLAVGGACISLIGGFFNGASTNNIVDFDNTDCQASAISNDNPLLGALSDNGGPTQTMEPSSGSPAINSGDMALCPALDQRGVARPQPADGACDVGAVEVAVRSFNITKSTSNTFIPGRQYTYDIQVTNTSDATANDVLVTDLLDSNLSYVADSITGPGNDDSGAPTLSWDIGTLDPNATVNLSYEVIVNAPENSTIPNVAEMTTSSPAAQTVFTASTSTPVGTLFAEIDLQGNGISIPDGDDTPSAADNTDFGVSNVDTAEFIIKSFDIANLGTIPLNLTGDPNVSVSGSSFFSVSTQPLASTVAADGAQTFEVTFAPGTQGTHEATIEILSDDADESSYAFKVVGVGCVNNILVTDWADAGPGTLRQAVTEICEGGTIGFDASLSGRTVELVTDQLLLDKDVTIETDVPVTISGLSVNRIFEVVDANVTIDGLYLYRGSAGNGSDGKGGAILIDSDSTVNVLNTTISASSADLGGAIWNEGTLTMANSTLSGNSATIRGGAVYNSGDGGINNTTIFDNSAPNASGLENVGSAFELSNTIIASSSDGEDCITSTPFVQSFNNLIEDGTCSPAIQADPLLGELRLGGGSSTSPTHTPLAGSPAIDAGESTVCEPTDQRGVARPQGATCDIGAHEVQPTDIEITKVGTTDAISSGDTMSYTIRVENIGSGTAFDLVVADQLASTLTYVPGSAMGGTSQNDSDAQNLSWTIDSLDAGESVLLSFSANIEAGLSDGTTVDNTATVTGSTPDTNPANDSSTFSFTIDNTVPLLSSQPTIGFAQSTYTAQEGDGTATIDLTLSRKVGYAVTAGVKVVNRLDLNADAATEETINVMFMPNEDSTTVEVNIPQDLFYEGIRLVDLEITNVANAKINGTAFATLEVGDDDAAPLMSVRDLRAVETDGATNFDFEVNLDQAAAVTITVDYSVSTISATVGEDLQDANGTLVIPPGSTSGIIRVVVLGDTDSEGTESFSLNLSNPVNAEEFDFTAIGTIENDDGAANSIFIPMLSQP